MHKNFKIRIILSACFVFTVLVKFNNYAQNRSNYYDTIMVVFNDYDDYFHYLDSFDYTCFHNGVLYYHKAIPKGRRCRDYLWSKNIWNVDFSIGETYFQFTTTEYLATSGPRNSGRT